MGVSKIQYHSKIKFVLKIKILSPFTNFNLREQSIGETSEVYEASGPSVSPMDTSLVLLIFCIVFVILLLFVHVKRIIHSNRQVFYPNMYSK